MTRRARRGEGSCISWRIGKSDGAQTKENLAKFIKAVEPFNLTPAECLNLINSKPTTDVEIHLLVEDCEKRLKESEVEHLLKLSADLL